MYDNKKATIMVAFLLSIIFRVCKLSHAELFAGLLFLKITVNAFH